ncbi:MULTISPECIES: tyrosine-type recombinase/integrase [unclassified Streptomyces]|uniref:tyrosine-type recombinase/integrase n=1 Tax=unclassified Streptomyces TaxID=2593676 RepID=UPI000DDB4953|nr:MULTISPECIES: tyrosine-type recombinase/integrase [unclassified Streptomyces]QZZ29335.1 site-specific integrase [Streptomyces sp. ST1015]
MRGSISRTCYCRDAQTGEHYRADSPCPLLSSPKHGTWSVRQEVSPSRDGKRRQFRRSGFGSLKDASRELDLVRSLLALADEDEPEDRRLISDMIMLSTAERSPLPDVETTARLLKAGHCLTSRVTVGEWLDAWLKAKKKLRATGARRYEVDIRCHLRPRIGHIRLDKLRVEHLDEMFEGIAATNQEIAEQNAQRRQAVADLESIHGRAARRTAHEAIATMPPFRRTTGLSTQHHIKTTLRAALNSAIARQLITFNPAAYVELETAPKPKALVWTAACVAEWKRTGIRPSPVMVWTPDQTGAFLDHVADHHLYALWHLLTFRGPRRGEGLGARWVDFDRDGRTLAVETQLVQLGWDVYEGSPKTASGVRLVALDHDTTDALLRHEKAQQAERLRFGPGWADTGRIFVAEDGTWLHPAKITAMFTRLVEETGLPPVRLHDLRHLAATLALLAGIDPKVVSEMLGHSDSAIMRDIYQTVLEEIARDAAEAVVKLVPRKTTHPSTGTAA